jgi:hypothetical protein
MILGNDLAAYHINPREERTCPVTALLPLLAVNPLTVGIGDDENENTSITSKGREKALEGLDGLCCIRLRCDCTADDLQSLAARQFRVVTKGPDIL